MTLKQIRQKLIGKKLYLDGDCVGRIIEVSNKKRGTKYHKVFTRTFVQNMTRASLEDFADAGEIVFVYENHLWIKDDSKDAMTEKAL